VGERGGGGGGGDFDVNREIFFLPLFLAIYRDETLVAAWLLQIGIFRVFFFLNRIDCFRYYSDSIHPLLIEITEIFLTLLPPIDHRNSKT
jgi:hypothetical protein